MLLKLIKYAKHLRLVLIFSIHLSLTVGMSITGTRQLVCCTNSVAFKCQSYLSILLYSLMAEVIFIDLSGDSFSNFSVSAIPYCDPSFYSSLGKCTFMLKENSYVQPVNLIDSTEVFSGIPRHLSSGRLKYFVKNAININS